MTYKEIFIIICIPIIIIACVGLYYIRACRIFEQEHPSLEMDGCRWLDGDTWKDMKDYK